MITLEHVSITLGDFSLYSVDLHINRGEYFMFMGPSGSGKTVLLEIIAGLRTPDSGGILLGGIDAGIIPLENKGISIVYQDYSLFPHMTAFENIAFGLRLRRIAEPEIGQRVRSLLSEFNIIHLTDHYPSSMSGGEQQRVALARALAVQPEILLLDEPFAALDPRSREECMRMMLAVKESQNLTIIQVSHSREEAFGVSDRVALLIDGSIIQTGSADEIFHDPRTTAAAKYAGIDNIFGGIVLGTDGASSRVNINGHQITIRGISQVGSPVSLYICGEHITLVEKVNSLTDSSTNTVEVTVSEILPMEHMVKIHLVGAISLTAVIKRYDGSMPLPSLGDHIVALFRAEDVHLLDEEG